MHFEPQIFVGDASDAEARVYVACPRNGFPDGARLTGELVGPSCRYSKTLAARIRFRDLGPGPGMLAEAIVPDPCFWSPELPFTYLAEIGLATRGGMDRQEYLLTATQRIGIRRLGVHRASIYLDAKRFVFRGVGRPAADVDDLAAARAAGSTLYVGEPDAAFLQQASDEGVLCVVDLSASDAGGACSPLTDRLGRLGHWPAVAICVLDADAPGGSELRLAARNLLLAQRCTTTGAEATIPQPWAHALWCSIESASTSPPSETSLPVIVHRPLDRTSTVAEDRRECDRLQADLASVGDFAGYFV